jgi:hypothetical protein
MYAQTNSSGGIIITEIMADPAPPVLLPSGEYLELYNASTDTINLLKWIIQVGNNIATINRSFELAPDRYVILCTPGMILLFDSSVQAIGLTGFPALDNDGALVQLIAVDGKRMHAVNYHHSWYQAPAKTNGGWSLEMIDVANPCLAKSNWKASTHFSGGTPGKPNSVAAIVIDDKPPRLIRTVCMDSLSLIAVFNEALDSASAAIPVVYSINNGMIIQSAKPVSPLFNTVLLTLQQPLQIEVEYLLQCNNVKDCSGNAIGSFRTAKAGLPSVPDTTSIVINEILFNPASGGSDYIELLNRSQKIFDLKDLLLASRNATNGLQSVIPCSNSPHLLFPGDHVVFTTDSLYAQQQYLVKEPENLIEIAALPSLPDNEGWVVLLTKDSKVVDEVNYSEKWHFPLLNNKEGVSLERIAATLPSNDPSNWTSATSTAGFGTPTYTNSQGAHSDQGVGTFQIIPAVFSPDGDGNNDFAMIEFSLDRPGLMGTVTIFDMRGRPVRLLVTNTSLAQSGRFRWDGLDQHQRAAPPGMYIVLLDVFNLQGTRKKYKGIVVVAKSYK